MVLDPETLPGYARLACARARGMDRAEDYVEWARAAIEEGLEGESLMRLAVAEPPYFTPDLRHLFDRAGEELGVAPITQRQGVLLGARNLARSILEGRISPGDGAASLNALFGPYFRDAVLSSEMRRWCRLDDAYDCEHCRGVVEEAGTTLDEAVAEAARGLLEIDWRKARAGEDRMRQSRTENEIAALDDVELIRLLTRNAGERSPEAIAAATAEATRRGLPIDEAFIPPADEAEPAPDEEAAGSTRFAVAGKPVRCPHCGGDRFEAREVLMNTRGLTFLKLDWMNRSATALVCGACGNVQLFTVKPEEILEQG